jgi:hypothetical protein
MVETAVHSFILRFAQESPAETLPTGDPWRGFIRHVQTNEQVRFTHIEDALNFIANYVELTRTGDAEPSPPA